ncbi:MAG: hypothetical protein IPP72_03035 [Chitinophagaceae bacterium]|nr:hypothetical protein [Chitinophagaceae bacterium]
MKFSILVLLITGASQIYGQKINLKAATNKLIDGRIPGAKDFGFEDYKVPFKRDTISFYTYHKSGSIPNSIYMFLPGSDAENIYTYHKDGDSSVWYNSLIDFDFSYLPTDYLFVVVAKPGFGFCGKADTIPNKYWEYTSLSDRVNRAEIALQYVQTHIIKHPKKVAVFGYSEGFYVGAKLAVQNRNITHLGIGGGGGYIDFYDFIIENQKQVLKGNTKTDSAIYYNQKLILDFADAIKAPDNSTFTYGYSNKRWATFSEPPIYNLVKLKIPIFQIHSSNDEMTPIENAYIVPLEFARLKKDNLTFSVCSNCNHSFIETSPNGREINHKQKMMTNFFEWLRIKN